MTLAAALVVLAAVLPVEPPNLEQARAYAPIVWVANNEPAYPMLPHPFAFDGIDNDCDGRYDLEDPTEIDSEQHLPEVAEYASLLLDADEQQRRYKPGESLPACLETRAFGHPHPDSGRTDAYFGPQARVLFVGPSDRDAVLGWNRDRAAIPAQWDRAIGRRTTLLQYWLYYPFDMGPNPHRHDGEHISVFVERDDADHPRVKAVVGAGHETNSVNNALIAAPLDTHPPANLILPRHLPDHMPILVELGKHASAPDVNCNGRFDLGADSNIYSESVWGSRDVWAGSAGKTLKVGRFEAWFSFPRSRTRRYLVDGWWEHKEVRDKYTEACEDLFLPDELPYADARAAVATEPPAAGEPPPETRSEKGSPLVQQEVTKRLDAMEAKGQDRALAEIARKLTRTYELFALRDLYLLYELLDSPRCRDDEACRVELEAFFNEPGRKESFWGSRALEGRVRVDREAARNMKMWPVERLDHVERRDVWKHHAFEKPASDFRMWLFKRVGVGYAGKIEGGNLVSGIVVRIADLVAKDSRVELYANLDRDRGPDRVNPDWHLYDAGIDFFSSRTRFFGAYFGLGYNNEFSTKVSASAGLNFYLANLPALKLPRDLSFSLYAGINGELFRERAGQLREAQALRFQVGARTVWGFWGPRHPLAR